MSDGMGVCARVQRYSRVGSIGASNFFKAVVYHPDESQILTCGTDRKVSGTSIILVHNNVDVAEFFSFFLRNNDFHCKERDTVHTRTLLRQDSGMLQNSIASLIR